MGWIGRSIGQFGADVGTGRDIALDWRAREQDMRLKAAQQKLQELMLPLQLQELQARLREMTQPKPAGIVGTRGGGQAGVTFEPGKGYSMQELEAGGDPENVKAQIEKMKKDAPKEFQASIQSHIDAIDAGADPMKELAGAQKDLESSAVKSLPTGTTLNRLQARADEQYRNGDLGGYAETQNEIAALARAGKPATGATKIGLILRANAGDKEAQQALKSLYEFDAKEFMARGEGWARARAQYQFQPYVNEDGQIVALNGIEALEKQRGGQQLTPVSRISSRDANAFQQFSAESAPAIADVRKWAKALDNPSDQAIFAGILSTAGPAPPGGEVGWLRNVLGQAGRAHLSAEGKQYTQSVARLNETVGRLRSILGLQATESAMALTLGLVPGPATPDSSYVLGYEQNGQHLPGQLDRLEAMAGLAMGVPAMRGVVGGAGRTPPPGSKIITLHDFLEQK